MIKLNFYLKSDKVNVLGEYPIFLKLTYQGKSTTLSSGKWLSKERWKSTNKLKNPLRLDKEKNCKLAMDRIGEQIENIYYELIKTSDSLTVLTIKNKYTGKTEKMKEVEVLSLFIMHNKNFKRKVVNGEKSKASLQKYERAKSLLGDFIFKKYMRKGYSLKDIDNQFVFNLESFLKYESTYKEKVGIGNNSVVKYFKTFKTVCNYAIKIGLINQNPFNCYDGKLIIKDAVFLSQEELTKIEEKELHVERLNRVRDIFLFSVYTSYAPVDVASLTVDNLVKDASGCLWIKTNRAKTNINSDVPVLPPVKRIIDKYSSMNGSKLLPSISNQKMNAYLKEIADICGINKKLTHYVARHTFATTVTLGNGVSIENVSSMMGHTRLTTTQHYAKVLDKNVKKDMNKLINKFC
jgi:site-specific recombinase XerD